MEYCLRHMEEPSTASCRSCRGSYCARCLVFAFGPKKPPYCVGCALHASGVRTGSRKLAAALPQAEVGTFGDPSVFAGVSPSPSDREHDHDHDHPGDSDSDSSTPSHGGGKRRLFGRGRGRNHETPEVESVSASMAFTAPLMTEPVLSPSEHRALANLAALAQD